MKITVIAFDTRGGVQPYAALALGLQNAGHNVQVAATENYLPMLTDRGLAVVPIAGDTEATVRASGGAAEMSRRERDRLMRSRSSGTTNATVHTLLDGSAGSDVLTGGVGGGLMGRPVAEKLGIPFIDAHLQPLGPPTGSYPGVLLQSPPWLGPIGNKISHRLSAKALQMPFATGSRQAREALGLPAEPAPDDPSLPALYGYSPRVVPKPSEWEARRHVTGYWPLPAEPGWTPPPGLEDFLQAAPPPVAMGFGSMNSRDPEALSQLLLAAARRARVRVVLLSGWGGLAASADSDVFVTDEAPHDWLYPRTQAVVHHGGAGTTGAAIMAGVPAIVVPFAVDQPFWGSRVAALGLGPTPIPRRRLTVDRLAAALRRTVADTVMRERAAAFGRQVRAERASTPPSLSSTPWPSPADEHPRRPASAFPPTQAPASSSPPRWHPALDRLTWSASCRGYGAGSADEPASAHFDRALRTG